MRLGLLFEARLLHTTFCVQKPLYFRFCLVLPREFNNSSLSDNRYFYLTRVMKLAFHSYRDIARHFCSFQVVYFRRSDENPYLSSCLEGVGLLDALE